MDIFDRGNDSFPLCARVRLDETTLVAPHYNLVGQQFVHDEADVFISDSVLTRVGTGRVVAVSNLNVLVLHIGIIDALSLQLRSQPLFLVL